MVNKDFLHQELYHGSQFSFTLPDIKKGRSGTDFGKGFYVTTSKQQAEKWARVPMLINSRLLTSYLYKFTCDNSSKLKIKIWEEPCEEWLHYVSANRRPKVFDATGLSLLKDYDVLIGPVADDDVGEVVENYLRGTYGKIASKEAIELAIRFCKTEIYKDQACFKNQQSIDCLVLKEVKSLAK